MDKEYMLDEEETMKQYYNSVIEKGRYVEARFLVEAGNYTTIPSVKVEHAGDREMACLIKSLETVREELIKQFPMAYMLTKHMDIDIEKM